MEIKTCYVSVGCNKTQNCLDWGQNKLICYPSYNGILIYQPKGPSKVIDQLVGHTDRVNAVRWIHNNKQETELVSVSTDKTCRVWNWKHGQGSCSHVLEGHTGTVNVVESVHISSNHGNRTLVATASVDSTVRVWQRLEGKEEFTCIQTISMGTGFAVAVSWICVPGTNCAMLACGGDDSKVRLYVEQDGQFLPVQTLHGHEDWIRTLQFTVDDSGDILLASGSQDTSIRIWRISTRDRKEIVKEWTLEDEIKMKEATFTLKYEDQTICYAVTLESVLQGHDLWVYSVAWQPATVKDSSRHQPMCLLSSSMDKTLILWHPDPSTGVWVEKMRVGEVGGNNLGFYGAVFGPAGDAVLSHGFQGALQMWSHDQETDQWRAMVTVGGHFDGVQDITWQPHTGHYLLSASLDQTTRCHGEWGGAWYEIARPQIHGYDLMCLAMIDRYSFACGADEKVIRCFEAPKNFIQNLGNISKVDVAKDMENRSAQTTAEGATVPALGLSNKAVYQGGDAGGLYDNSEIKPNSNEQYQEAYFKPQNMTEPPSETDLLQNTLWPETQKLYGHGYEIYSLATHPRGTLLASGCKASKAEHASVILWDTSSWRQLQSLTSHTLTVTQVAFSNNGDFLLTVSRDRSWALYKCQAEQVSYNLVYYAEKKASLHSRIIWGCAWSHDDQYFITISRDKKAVIWRNELVDGKIQPHGTSLDLPDSITAVEFAPLKLHNDRYCIALGLDNGDIYIYSWSDNTEDTWRREAHITASIGHQSTVRRVKFRPIGGRSTDVIQLASCSADHTVKIYDIINKS